VDCLAVSAGEDLLVVTDPACRDIAAGLVEQGRALGAETVLAEMSKRAGNGVEPPPHVAAAMLACDVFVAPTTKSLSHTSARRAATDAGVRAASMPGVTSEMLVRLMSADPERLRSRSAAVARALTDGRTVRITSEQGTDVTLAIEGRTGISDDGDLRSPGAFGNLPAGEAFIAPVEGATKGRIVFDGAAEMFGGEVLATIEDGYARLEGGGAPALQALLEPNGRDAFAVAELGIGTNEAAQLTGLVLEDEKILGTIHVAFGDNHSFGGKVRVSSHQDLVVLHPTVEIDGRPRVDGGRLLL
jgi:leucyl aminopeptidase (aminopeptidase T)